VFDSLLTSAQDGVGAEIYVTGVDLGFAVVDSSVPAGSQDGLLAGRIRGLDEGTALICRPYRVTRRK
jgi:hypothetical protein